MAVKKQNKKQVRQNQQKVERVTRLVAYALLMSLLTAVLFLQFRQWLMDPETLPVKVVKIDGDLKYLKKAELENAVASIVTGGFFNIDLGRIKNRAQQLAWVESVSVKRVWPDTLVMAIEEKVAIAHWGEKRLVTASGEIFVPTDKTPEELPYLQGPDSRVAEVVERFHREQLRFSEMQMKVSELKVNERGAWIISFANAVKVAVGKENIELRLDRLARYLERVRQIKGMPESIDLRYRHGMAVMWKTDEEKKSEVQEGKGAV